MDISVVIVSYNVREYIISCIESIYKHTNYEFKYIVDNNSSDQTIESVLKSFRKLISLRMVTMLDLP